MLFLPVSLCFTIKGIKELRLSRCAADQDKFLELQRASANSLAIASSTWVSFSSLLTWFQTHTDLWVDTWFLFSLYYQASMMPCKKARNFSKVQLFHSLNSKGLVYDSPLQTFNPFLLPHFIYPPIGYHLLTYISHVPFNCQFFTYTMNLFSTLSHLQHSVHFMFWFWNAIFSYFLVFICSSRKYQRCLM